MNFLKTKILFRCDLGDINELGSGHLYRCITIARFLKLKFKLRFEDIIFVIKTKKKYSKSSKLIKRFNFKFVSINYEIKDYSIREKNILSKFGGKLIIIDRLGRINKSFIINGLKNFEKKLIIDDSSSYRRLFDLSYNPLITNVKKVKKNFIGINNFISPIYFYKKNKVKTKSGIFVFFGGYDKKNLLRKIFKNINYSPELKFYFPEVYKKNIKKLKIKNRMYFFKEKEYYKYLEKSKFAILSAGMSVFDALYLEKKIICIPQYKHQLNNLYFNKIQNNLILLKNNERNFTKKFLFVFNQLLNKKNTIVKKRLFSKKNMNITLYRIAKLIRNDK